MLLFPFPFSSSCPRLVSFCYLVLPCFVVASLISPPQHPDLPTAPCTCACTQLSLSLSPRQCIHRRRCVIVYSRPSVPQFLPLSFSFLVGVRAHFYPCSAVAHRRPSPCMSSVSVCMFVSVFVCEAQPSRCPAFPRSHQTSLAFMLSWVLAGVHRCFRVHIRVGALALVFARSQLRAFRSPLSCSSARSRFDSYRHRRCHCDRHVVVVCICICIVVRPHSLQSSTHMEHAHASSASSTSPCMSPSRPKPGFRTRDSGILGLKQRPCHSVCVICAVQLAPNHESSAHRSTLDMRNGGVREVGALSRIFVPPFVLSVLRVLCCILRVSCSMFRVCRYLVSFVPLHFVRSLSLPSRPSLSLRAVFSLPPSLPPSPSFLFVSSSFRRFVRIR